jgi:plasmid replication initiation protein
MFFENWEKGIFAYFNATEIDLINYILYKSREHVITNKIDLTDAQDLILDLNLKEITLLFKKYQNYDYVEIIDYFRNLRYKEIVINALGKNKSCDTTYTSFLHKVTVSKHRDKELKNIKLQIDGEIVKMMLNVTKYYSKMHLSIQYSMKSKYSKLLYELLKDYEAIKQLTLDYDLLCGMLNIKNLTRYTHFSYMNGEILKPTVEEINEKSDIYISFEPIKERLPGQRLQVTKFKFFITKQPESRLQELGLIQPTIIENKYYVKSKTKLDNLIKNGYKVIDQEKWIETDIKKNEEKYESENRIDTWLQETSQDDKNNIFEITARFLDAEDASVFIDKDYLIRNIFTKEILTRNALETITKLNEVLVTMVEDDE